MPRSPTMRRLVWMLLVASTLSGCPQTTDTPPPTDTGGEPAARFDDAVRDESDFEP